MKELRDIAQRLNIIGEEDIADVVLCALAAATDAIEPKADLTYTHIMRNLREKNKKDDVRTFQKVFKDVFEEALDKDVDNPEKIALLEAMNQIKYEDD